MVPIVLSPINKAAVPFCLLSRRRFMSLELKLGKVQRVQLATDADDVAVGH